MSVWRTPVLASGSGRAGVGSRCYVAAMDPRTLARVIAIGRVVIGAALIVAPSKAAAGWVGEDSRRAPTQVALAAVGGRDLVLGLGAAWAVGGGDTAKPWLLAAAAAD